MSPGSRTSVELTDNGLLIAGALVREGDIPSIDGETGAVYLGPIAAAVPSIRISRFCEAGPPRGGGRRLKRRAREHADVNVGYSQIGPKMVPRSEQNCELIYH